MTAARAEPLAPRARHGRTLAVVGLLIEALAVSGLVVLGLNRVISGAVETRVAGLGVVGFAAVIAAALFGLTVAVRRVRRWAIAPAVTVQLFLVFAFGWPLLTQQRTLLGGFTLAVAVLTLVGLIRLAPHVPRPSRTIDP